MLREKKIQLVNKLTDDLARSTIVIVTNYRGLPVKQITELRHVLAKADADYHVVKNTLTRFAADKASKSQIMGMIEGPIALAFGYGDVVNLAKALKQYIKSTESPLEIKGGLLENRILTPEEIVNLASLPPKEVLISQLIAHLQAPVRGLYNTLNFPLQGLLNLLQSRAQKFKE
mgnify:CR=1 FL=1